MLFFPRVYPAGFAKAIVKSLPSIRWERRTFDLEAASLLLKAENKVRTGAPKLWTKKKHPTLLGLNLLPIKSPLSNPQGRYYHLFAKSSDSVVVDSLGRCGSEAMSSVRVWSEAAECSIWLVGLSYFCTAIETFFRLGCAIFRRSRWLYTYQRGCCVEWSLPLHLQTIGNGICNHVWECLGMEYVKTNWNLYQIVFFAKSERAKIPDERAKIPDERAKKKNEFFLPIELPLNCFVSLMWCPLWPICNLWKAESARKVLQMLITEKKGIVFLWCSGRMWIGKFSTFSDLFQQQFWGVSFQVWSPF